MDEQKKQTESLNVGAVAVVNADKETAPNLGSLAIKNADEKLLEPGEHLVKTVYRHPIGIVGIYAEMTTGIVVMLVLLVLGLAGTFGPLNTSTKALAVLGTIIVSIFLAGILLLSAHVYRKSRLLIADKSLVSTVQRALFSRKIARLSMANVEDVTCDQKGILQSLFNYGTLTIQTAGQEDNFIFPYCPKPNEVADQIIEARQAFVRMAD